MGIIAALALVLIFGFALGYTFCEFQRYQEETKGDRPEWK